MYISQLRAKLGIDLIEDFLIYIFFNFYYCLSIIYIYLLSINNNKIEMKIFGPKSLSYYLFYLSRFATIGSLLLILFILISLSTENFEMVNGQFQINLPLIPNTKIKGYNQTDIITTITLLMLFSSVFFYMLSNILKTFKALKLFTHKAVKQLNYFALLNLVVGPILYFIIQFAIMQKSDYRNIHNLVLSIILGVFVLFVASVFKHGFQVQKENDLTI